MLIRNLPIARSHQSMFVPNVVQAAFSDLEDLLDASHKLVEESVDSRTRSQQASPSVTIDVFHQVCSRIATCPSKSADVIMMLMFLPGQVA